MSKGGRNEKPLHGIVGGILLVTFCVLGTVLIWASSEHGPQPVASSYEASKYHVSAQNRIQSNCAGLEGVSFSECLIDIEQSERESHNAQKDVRAQRYMAIWAFIMAYAAIVTMGVTTAGLSWIKATFDETRRAANIADRVGKKQTRAYIGFECGEITTADDEITVHIPLRNAGQSPAKDITAGGVLSLLCDWTEGSIETFKSKHNGCAVKNISVGQHIVAEVKLRVPSDFPDLAKLSPVEQSKRHPLISEVQVDYCISWFDVFGDRQDISCNLHLRGCGGKFYPFKGELTGKMEPPEIKFSISREPGANSNEY